LVFTSVCVLSGRYTVDKLDRHMRHTLQMKDVVADILPPPMYLIEMRLVASRADEGALTAAQAETEFKRLQQEYQERLELWRGQAAPALLAVLDGPAHAAAQELMALVQQHTQRLLQGDSAGAHRLMGPIEAAYQAHRRQVDTAVLTVNQAVAASLQQLDDSIGQSATLLWGLLAAVVVLLSAMAWAITRSILQPLDRARVAVHQVAQGDLTRPVAVHGRDELAELSRGLEAMRCNLADMVGLVRHNADSVATASTQISQGNLDLSQRTEEQASTLQQTASAMEVLQSTVSTSAQHGQEAHRLAQEASAVAAQGGQAVAQVIDKMSAIAQSSQKISEINAVIDGIAFQTNILALNAAVEAARAGEQGRGFAVVASEVRALAQRSAAAAKEINELISQSVSQVQEGHALVERAGDTMHHIVSAIGSVSDLVTRMSTASHQQSHEVTQIGQSVFEMDKTTQQNAALVEESAAAAESLRQQAQELVAAASRFQLGHAH